LAARGRKGAREFDNEAKNVCDDFLRESEFDLHKISFALILQGRNAFFKENIARQLFSLIFAIPVDL
jgi:hypothetical protein